MAITILDQNDKQELQEQIDELKNTGLDEVLSADITPLNIEVLNGYIVGDHKKPTTNTWYETVSWRTTVIPVNKIVSLTRAELNTNTPSAYAVSFYSSEAISADSFISGLLFNSNVPEEFTDIVIPSNAVIAVFCDRVNTDNLEEEFISSIEGVAKSVIKDVYDDVNEVRDAVVELDGRIIALESVDVSADIEILRNEKPVDLMTDDFKFGTYYINSSGKMAASGSWSSYAVENIYTKIVFNGYTNSVVNYTVGFYASDIPTDDAFLSSLNVTPSSVVQEIIIDKSNTPEGTKSILFCSRTATGGGSSLVGFTTIVEQVDNLEKSMVEVDGRIAAVAGELSAEIDAIQNELAGVTGTRLFGKGNIKAIYRDIPNTNDFAVIGDELWFAEEEGHLVHRYRVESGALVKVGATINSDFGHWNCVDYNADNDCLVFGNAANATNTDGNFFSIVNNPRALSGTVSLATHSIKYPVDIGYKVQAVWGDSNLGKNNIVYLFSNNAQTIVKVMLKQNEDGSFYKNLDTGEGEYTVLETAEQTTNIGVGGGDFWGDTLYIGDGVDHGWYEMSMSDYTTKHIKKNFYRDDGTMISGCTQGVYIDSDYLWVYYNVTYATQERNKESYLVQYYR